jgi:hypothetical protein
MISTLQDPELIERLRYNGFQTVKDLNWDKAFRDIEEFVLA